jgi:hypothetical protein
MLREDDSAAKINANGKTSSAKAELAPDGQSGSQTAGGVP